MDWGLFDSAAGENKFLREEIVYSSKVTTVKISVLFFLSTYNVVLSCYFLFK